MKRSPLHPISKKQIKAIQTLRRGLKMSDDDYKSMLAGYNVTSCTELVNDLASDLISKLGKLVPSDDWRQSGKYYGTGERGGQRHLTQLQADRIDVLEKMLSWERSSTVSFVIRQLGAVKCVSMLMNYEAVKVITGMQKVLSTNMASAEGRSTANRKKEFYDIINMATNNQLKEIYEAKYNTAAERN